MAVAAWAGSAPMVATGWWSPAAIWTSTWIGSSGVGCRKLCLRLLVRLIEVRIVDNTAPTIGGDLYYTVPDPRPDPTRCITRIVPTRRTLTMTAEQYVGLNEVDGDFYGW